MYFIAFETSCDDTSIAVFQDEKLLSLYTKSQITEHNETQWVVPEVAARLHANVIFSVLGKVMKEANLSFEQIDFIACTQKPGLLPSLLVWQTVAKTLAHIFKKPLLPIDHIEAHIFANLLERSFKEIVLPAVCLTVSWGHNELYLWSSPYDLKLIGQTRDDAAWEAFDKISKALWLTFPGGPVIARFSSEYRKKHSTPLVKFPRPLLEKESLDFSFSWLKSATKRAIDLIREEHDGDIPHADIERISAEFEEAVIDTLTEKLFRAAWVMKVSHVILAWGVSANERLREKIWERSKKEWIHFTAPTKLLYSMDNAAMVGIRAWYEWKKRGDNSLRSI